MYISKFLLDIKNREVNKSLQDYNKMHKLIWTFFDLNNDKGISRSNLNILYRVVCLEQNIFLYVQSECEPIKELVGVTKIYSVTLDVLYSKLKNNTIVNFNILVNPIIQENNKRRFLTSYIERDYWLKKYSLKNGFEFLNYVEKNTVTLKIKKDKEFIVKGVEYYGQLKIVDLEKFKSIYLHGLGTAKSYGMGLLLLS